MQADPNASALALLEAASYNGRGVGALAIAFDLSSRHGDGANLYEYLGSNPWNRSDPMGLSWDPFDMVDEYLAEDAGNKAAYLTALGQGGKAVAIVAAQIATYLPFPAASVAGELALVALGEQSGDTAAIAIGVGLIPGGKLMGKLNKFMSGAYTAAWRATKDIISKKGANAAKWFLRGGIYGQMFRTARGVLSKCGCFTPETRVWTATGLVAIALIQPGDMVFALDEATGETSLRMVTEVYEREGDAPLVIVHVSSGETIETTEEHPFLVSGQWVRADRLSRGDELDGAFGCVSVVAVEHTSRLSRVHNLEVEGLHNYRVGTDGVVVHNGDDACDIELLKRLYVIPNAALIKSWFKEGLDNSIKAGAPPIGLTPQVAHAYIKVLREQVSKAKGAGEIPKARIDKLVQYFGEP